MVQKKACFCTISSNKKSKDIFSVRFFTLHLETLTFLWCEIYHGKGKALKIGLAGKDIIWFIINSGFKFVLTNYLDPYLAGIKLEAFSQKVWVKT